MPPGFLARHKATGGKTEIFRGAKTRTFDKNPLQAVVFSKENCGPMKIMQPCSGLYKYKLLVDNFMIPGLPV